MACSCLHLFTWIKIAAARPYGLHTAGRKRASRDGQAAAAAEAMRLESRERALLRAAPQAAREGTTMASDRWDYDDPYRSRRYGNDDEYERNFWQAGEWR